MPAGNRTGPLGMGPMTGRRAGYCAGFATPGYANPYGRGGGIGWGGRGHRHCFYATGVPGWVRFGTSPGQPSVPGPGYAPAGPRDIDALRQQAEWLKDQLDAVGKRISELEQGE